MKKFIHREQFFLSLLPVIVSNSVISMVISAPLFKYGVQGDNMLFLIINIISFISHYFLLNCAVGVIVLILSFILPRRITFFLKISLFSLLQILLIIDTQIYTLFHFHINSLVLNIITTEGVSDSVILGKGTLANFAIRAAVVIFVEAVINTKLASLHKKLDTERMALFMRASKILFTACLVLIVFDKGMYAYGDLFNRTEITKNAKLYPLYQPFTIKRFASKVLNMQVNRELNFSLSASNTLLKYPKKQLVFEPLGNRNYNIVLIVLDGLRFDMLNEEVMPNLSSFSKDNIIYNNHHSGGNGTRFGIFSLLYGVHGTYWHTFLAHRKSSVLIDSLYDRGYDFIILSSTLLTFPEFRKTAFVKIPGKIHDTYGGDSIPLRDELLTKDFIRYISSRKPQSPFFAFLYYNSSHQPFAFPDGFKRFEPISGIEIDYFRDIERDRIELLKNRYKNAVFYEDYLVGMVIRSLEENNLLERTIVIITGDHGEEFYENGLLGHTSSFNDYQLKTVFVLHYPGIKHRTVQRITSHMDLVPTLMESIGCVSFPGDYSQGFSLLKEKDHTYITAANWNKAAIIDNEFVIVYSTELYEIGSFEVYRKSDYAPVKDSQAVFKRKKVLLIDSLTKLSEFYRDM